MTGIDNYEYAQWVINIGRSLRFNPPFPWENPICENFYTYEVGRRPWLWDKFFRLSQREQGGPDGTPEFRINTPQTIGRIIEAIGRNMMKVNVLDADEKTWIDGLIAATSIGSIGQRRFGSLGNRIGSDVHQP